MSTKTLRKRIALVAVAGLGFGLLSATTASAVGETGGFNIAANGGTSADSRGIVTEGGIAVSGATAKLNTLKIVSGGSLVINADKHGSGVNVIMATGGIITSCSATTTAVSLTATGSTCKVLADEDLTFTVVPVTGATAFVVSQLNPAADAEMNRVTVSVVASTTVGAFAASKSNIKATQTNSLDISNTGVNVDEKYESGSVFYDDATYRASTTTVANGEVGYLYFDLKDSNDNALGATTTGVSATATGGCLVGFDSSANAIGTGASDVDDNGFVYIKQAVANVPVKCVVTLAVNGTVVSTKTYTIQGQVTKLEVSEIVIGAAGTTVGDAFLVDAQDSAGNSIPGVTITDGGSLTGAVQAITTSTNTNVTDGGVYASVECATKGLAKDLKVATTNASAATIYSDAFSMQCSGSPVNYTASLDKASYTIGEVATLTITAKDSAGNLTWDGATLADPDTATTATNTAVSIAGGPLAQVGSIVSTDSFTSGVKKYKFTVGGISSGSFQLVVDLPNLNSPTYSQSAQTVAYKVTTSADSGVQMADVLKAIVSLIASINKQIAALQKALLKK